MSLRILIVEDDLTSQRLLAHFLGEYGRCEIAGDGETAVAMFRLAIEVEHRYDLVCLDIMMPGMDGHEALRAMRGLEEAHGIAREEGARIVITSALDDSKSVLEAFDARCDGYLVKPYEKTRITDELRVLSLF